MKGAWAKTCSEMFNFCLQELPKSVDILPGLQRHNLTVPQENGLIKNIGIRLLDKPIR